ncbi:hypothetical protein ACLHXE_23960, partial [Pseudomonas aeruginosa]
MTGNVKKNSIATPVRTLSEQLGERGAGSMLLERRPSGVIEVYLSRRANGRQERSKLGVFAEVVTCPPDFSTTSNLVESVFRAGDGSEK